MKRFLPLILLAALALAACSDGGGDVPPPLPTSYAVAMSNDGHGTAAATVNGAAATTAEAGAMVTITATPAANYVFKQWVAVSGSLPAFATGSATTSPATFAMPAAAVSIKAEFEPVLYGITMSNDGHGTAAATANSSAATMAAAGITVTITATPAADYMFKQWVVQSGGVTLSSTTTSPATFAMPAAAVSIKAEFEQGASINGVRWALYNVDAPGTFAATPESAGMFYQWNRKTAWLSTGNTAVSSPAGSVWDDTTPAGDSWAAANDPCPAGWRMPAKDEQAKLLDAANVNGIGATLNGVVGYRFTDKTSGAAIFLAAPGCRFGNAGSLTFAGSNGYYWSGDSYSAAGAWHLFFRGDGNNHGSFDRTAGFSVRCVRQ